jgi:hypothetical protein
MADANEEGGNTDRETESLSERIKQLGEKSTQILLFISFAMVSVATLKIADKALQSPALESAFFWWKIALFPTLLGVLPLKEFRWEHERWYNTIRMTRFVLLWIAVVIILIGAAAFLYS